MTKTMNSLSLKHALLELPEPVLILGNRIPDGDSLGSCIAVLDYLLSEGREAYVHCVEQPGTSLIWMLDGVEAPGEETLEDYKALVVLDDKVDSLRLGFELIECPTVCVDHHKGNFFPCFEPEDDSLQVYTIEDQPHIRYYHMAAPATASLLIEEDILHPYLLASLFTDTVAFTVNCSRAFQDASNLIKALEMTDSECEEIISSLQLKGSLDSLFNLVQGKLYLIKGQFQGKELTACILAVDELSDEDYPVVLGTIRRYSDVCCLVNRDSGRCSIRSKFDDFEVLSISQRFGGGGHLRAAGFTIKPTLVNIEKILDLICERLNQVEVRMVS